MVFRLMWKIGRDCGAGPARRGDVRPWPECPGHRGGLPGCDGGQCAEPLGGQPGDGAALAGVRSLKRCGLPGPPLAITDGAPGMIRAVETCCPRALRQPCLVHRLRNLRSKAPDSQCRHSPNHAIHPDTECITASIIQRPWDLTLGTSMRPSTRRVMVALSPRGRRS